MLRFQHNEYLLASIAVPLLVLLYFYVLKWKAKTIRLIGDERLVKAMTDNYSSRRFAVKFILVAIAFIVLVLALANLRAPQGTEKITRNGIDVMIALDVSKSMLAQDIKPSRLERAKQFLNKLMDKISNDRIGIVVFAGKAYLQMPLTGDHGAAKMYLSTASPDIVPTQGTVIADALQMCSVSFNSKEKKFKSVILISDGEDHDEGAMKMAEQMAGEGIVINPVGIGSLEGTTITDATTNEVKKDDNGNIVITKLNEEELRNIALKGNGIYQLFTNTDDVVSKMDAQLASMDQRAVTDDSLVNYRNYFQFFLLAALILLVLETGIGERKKAVGHWLTKAFGKVTGKERSADPGSLFRMVLLFLLMGLPGLVIAQDGKTVIKKGNEAYAKKDFETAISQYKKAAELDPTGTIAPYNLGNALYKTNKPEDAIASYENALAHSPEAKDRSKAFYNKGVVLQNNKKLPECIDAYKNALKLNPEDEDARQNLQKALQQQKQEQQKGKKDKPKNQPKDKQYKEKQKPREEDKKKDEPKPQPSKMSKQDAEENLKALLQQEKNLQDKLKKVNAGVPGRPEKDW